LASKHIKEFQRRLSFLFFGYRRACVERRLNLAQTEEEDMDDLKTLETKLNALFAKGEMIEAVEQFYADDCVYQEGNQPPRTGGKKGQKEHFS
jgi:hypothetical protein